ncbi:hypothetical protein [Polluticoccus soli]|uniref:hypothetical protein n=1 Tax=Polluticoccus soli TaxID=3034150 RepID=UPI0023E0943F|nr:hypothetical protein [Flavipsychrobacter sp. JY13-12]
MTQHEYNLLDRQLKNFSYRNLITLVVSTVTTVATVLGVYYGFRTEQALMKLEIKLLEQRIERLERQ